VFDQREDVTIVKLPYFGDEEHEGVIERAIPTITVQTVDGPVKVTTVYDLILANYGIDRGIGGEVAKDYTIAISAFTPVIFSCHVGVYGVSSV